MNFRQRLTNVLLVVAILAGLLAAAFMIDDGLRYESDFYKVLSLIVCPLIGVIITSALSYLMGTGFKPWHKENK